MFCYAFMHVCFLMSCGHLLGKGLPIGPRLCCLIVKLSLSNWYPGSGVVLDCINSWSLPSFLFCTQFVMGEESVERTTQLAYFAHWVICHTARHKGVSYLISKPFKVITGCRSLQYLKNMALTSGKLALWNIIARSQCAHLYWNKKWILSFRNYCYYSNMYQFVNIMQLVSVSLFFKT